MVVLSGLKQRLSDLKSKLRGPCCCDARLLTWPRFLHTAACILLTAFSDISILYMARDEKGHKCE